MRSKSKNAVWLVAVLVVAVSLILLSIKDKRKDTAEMIVGIHIKGEVNVPGYYELEYGSRVKDAIDYAGGKTENADTDSVNLAMKLFDGQEIIIPATVSEAETDAQQETATEDKININQADKSTLCKLEGIGESTAQAIVDYRTTKGAFKTAKEITKVKGIGESKYKTIKDKITV